ncbi:hypothetical protein GOV12_07205 [Candidatus Pacearchaeota archaeon]|nr:hypothetical protein [Candidatus Pacearchaeota archaeon]
MVSKKELKKALEEAGSSHGDYEVNILNGVYDDDWPLWYAAFLAGKLGLRPSVMTRLLKEAQESHEKNNPKSDWTVYYSEFIIEKLEAGYE